MASESTSFSALNDQDDWQSSKGTILKRNTYMFDNPLISDVAFTCGKSNRVFYAHKYVLATSSSVFFVMFHSELAQKESPITIPNINEKSFEEFLRFLYTDDCNITLENVIEVMNLAKIYFVSSLAEKCFRFLEAGIIDPDTVLAVLEQAIRHGEKNLEARCWDVISTKTVEVVHSEEFCNIRSYTLNALLKKETLKIKEIELFKRILEWIDSECGRQNLKTKDVKMVRRRVLGDNLFEIRFLSMSQEDFAKHVTPTGLLTEAETISIFQELNGLNVAGLSWKQRSRLRWRSLTFSRFSQHNLSTNSWFYGGKVDGLTLSVNKAVFFYGARLFGNLGGGQYEVTFTIKNETLTGVYTSEEDNDGVWGYDVSLPKPISLLPDEDFIILAKTKGPNSYHGRDGIHKVKVNDIILTMKDSCLSSNSTSVKMGQFYKFFLSEI